MQMNIKTKCMSKAALEILEQIKEHVNECCAITMEPDTVLDLIEELETILNKEGENDN